MLQQPSKRVPLFWGILFVALGFIFLAPARLDIAVILPEVMHGIGVTSLAVGGLISTLTVLGDGLTEPFWGRWVDSASPRVTLPLGLAIFSLFTLLTAAAHSLGTMIGARILLGVGQGLFIPAYMVFIGRQFKNHRGFALGSLAGLFPIGVTLNPLITKSVFNAYHHAWQAPFVAYGIFGLALAVVIVLMGRTQVYSLDIPVARAKTSRPPMFKSLNRSMVLLLLALVFWGVTQYGFLGLFITFLRTHQHFTLGTAATVASIAGAVSFVFSFIGGWMSDHIGRRNALIIFGLVGVICAFPLFTLTKSFWPALIFAAIFEAANGMFYPLGVAYAQDMAKAEDHGQRTGLASGIGHIMAGLAGLIVGSIASSFGFGMVAVFYLIASLIMTVAIYLTVDPVHQARRALRTESA